MMYSSERAACQPILTALGNGGFSLRFLWVHWLSGAVLILNRWWYSLNPRFPKSGTRLKVGSRSDLRWVTNMPKYMSKWMFYNLKSCSVQMCRKYQEDTVYVLQIFFCFIVDGSPHLIDRYNWAAKWKHLGTPATEHVVFGHLLRTTQSVRSLAVIASHPAFTYIRPAHDDLCWFHLLAIACQVI